MVRTRRTGFGARSVGVSVVAIFAVALFSAGVAHAQCTDCTFSGVDAGTGSTGTFESGFGAW
jgi:hypothetical protein